MDAPKPLFVRSARSLFSPTMRGMLLNRSNERASLDAAVAFSLRLGRQQRRASEPECQASEHNIEDSTYETKENELGTSGARRIHWAAFGGVRSPAPFQTQGASIAHFRGQQHFELLDDEHECARHCRTGQVRFRTLNPAAPGNGAMPLSFHARRFRRAVPEAR